MSLEPFTLKFLQNTQALLSIAVGQGINTTEDLSFWLDNHIQKRHQRLVKHGKEQIRDKERIEGGDKTLSKAERKERISKRLAQTKKNKVTSTIPRTFPNCPDCGKQLYPQLVREEPDNDRPKIEELSLIIKCDNKCWYSEYIGPYDIAKEKYPEYMNALEEMLEEVEGNGI